MNESAVMFEHGGVELVDTDKRYIVKVNGKEVYRSPFHSDPCYCNAYRVFRKEAYGEVDP